MPRIIVQADPQDGTDAAVLMAERVNASDFESRHFSDQLVERIGWAVFDAVEAEDGQAAAPDAAVAGPAKAQRRRRDLVPA
ncbi:MAG: hypothetical protein E6G56_14195 [Actinobacteria bacterium]|nr:MAG: hypothetical protein E6G56_14195 [Actinomycetota bacterium]